MKMIGKVDQVDQRIGQDDQQTASWASRYFSGYVLTYLEELRGIQVSSRRGLETYNPISTWKTT